MWRSGFRYRRGPLTLIKKEVRKVVGSVDFSFSRSLSLSSIFTRLYSIFSCSGSSMSRRTRFMYIAFETSCTASYSVIYRLYMDVLTAALLAFVVDLLETLGWYKCYRVMIQFEEYMYVCVSSKIKYFWNYYTI